MDKLRNKKPRLQGLPRSLREYLLTYIARLLRDGTTLPQVLVELVLDYQEAKLTVGRWTRKIPVRKPNTPTMTIVEPKYLPKYQYRGHVTINVGGEQEYKVKRVETSRDTVSYHCQREEGRDAIEIELPNDKDMDLSEVMLTGGRFCVAYRNVVSHEVFIFRTDIQLQ